jgi:hypothetical protein
LPLRLSGGAAGGSLTSRLPQPAHCDSRAVFSCPHQSQVAAGISVNVALIN